MAFKEKTDYIGLTTTIGDTYVKLRANNKNASNQLLQIHGSDGSYIGDEIYGHIAAPNCEYAILKESTVSGLELGKVYSTGTVPYALQHIHITTGAGAEPTLTADAVQIEAGATRAVCTYSIPDFTISPKRHAMDFGALASYSYTGSYYGDTADSTPGTLYTIENAEYDAAVTLQPATINGDPVGSDAVEGVVNVNITMWANTDESASLPSAASGWHQTADWNCVGADA